MTTIQFPVDQFDAEMADEALQQAGISYEKQLIDGLITYTVSSFEDAYVIVKKFRLVYFPSTEYDDDIENEAENSSTPIVFTRVTDGFEVITRDVSLFEPIYSKIRELVSAKIAHLTAIKNQIDTTLAAHYPVTDLLSLTRLYSKSLNEQLTERSAYLEQLSDWTDQLYGFFYTARTQVIAAATVDDVYAVTIDLTAWEAADPQVTYEAAMAITG